MPGEHEHSGLGDQRIGDVGARAGTIGAIRSMRSDRCQPGNKDMASQFRVTTGGCPRGPSGHACQVGV